jgi:NAD+ diphosphatase
LFNAGQPLASLSNDVSTKPSPIYLTTNDVEPFLGPTPYFGQGKEPGDLVHENRELEEDTHKEHSHTESLRHLGIPLVFLGVHEPQSSETGATLPTSEFSNPEDAIKHLQGTPYFAMDVADINYTAEQLRKILIETAPGREGKVLDWAEPRSLMASLDIFTAGVFASARSMVDWNLRNKVRHVYI